MQLIAHSRNSKRVQKYTIRTVNYTDHKNLTYKIFNLDQVIQWRLILEEYSPELIYIPGSKNIAADVLSRLDILDIPNPVINNFKSINEHYGLEY